MGWKSVVVVFVVLCGLLLSSCALFYDSIPPIEFSVECDTGDVELNVINMSRGSHHKREDGVIVAKIPSGGADITFVVRSGTQTSRFVARTVGTTGIKGVLYYGVSATYGFGGGMWLASSSANHYGHYKISGVAASPESFVVGRFVRDQDELVPLVDRVAPHTGIQFDSRSPGVLLTGRGGASVLVASGFTIPGKSLHIYAPVGSSVLIEQVDGRQRLEVGSSLPLRVEIRPGRAKIVWFPAGSDESHVEVIIDAVSEEYGYGGFLSFSSMLDKPIAPSERVGRRGSR